MTDTDEGKNMTRPAVAAILLIIGSAVLAQDAGGAQGLAGGDAGCVVYVRHEFAASSDVARRIAARADSLLRDLKPLGLAEPVERHGAGRCEAHFAPYAEGARPRTGQRELAVIRWFGPTDRAELEFALWYFVFDRPSPRRVRNTGGFPIGKLPLSDRDMDDAARRVAQVVVIGPNV